MQLLIRLCLLVRGIIGALKVKYIYPLFVVLAEMELTGPMVCIL